MEEVAKKRRKSRRWLRDFLRDHQQMSRLFQRFVCNFYRIERNDSSIRAEQIDWRVKTRQQSALKYLPRNLHDAFPGYFQGLQYASWSPL